MNLRHTSTLLVTALTAAMLVATPATAAPQSGPNCTPLLKQAMNGKAAENALGANFTAAAARNNRSPEALRQLLTDPTFWLDTCAQGYYVEEAPTAEAAVTAAAPFPYTQTFLLHSNPGASKTIYLDFTGYTSTNTGWNSGTIVANPYNTDGNAASFSTAEQDVIQQSWQVVAEDYAAFDVDVTTEEPPAARLERTDGNDNEYGTRAVITQNTMGLCGGTCGGVAYLGVFDATGSTHEYYQPAWVFNTGLRGVSEAISHEVGHNLNLQHDGRTSACTGTAEGYYQGTGGWAPIMGVGYYEPFVQWSKGEYPCANNTQDDFSEMAANGMVQRTDEDSNTSATARSVSAGATVLGYISSRTDSDWFSVVPSVSTTYTFSTTLDSQSPNLDLRMDLLDSSGNVIAFNNPLMTRVSSAVASGLTASLSQSLTAGQTYYVKLDGVGKGSWATGADYNDYASMGAYSMTVTSAVIAVGTSSLPSATVGRPYSTTAAVSGGTGPFTWSATGLPAGLTIGSSTGTISGTPTGAGSSSVTITVTDAVSASAQSTMTLVVAAAPAISTSSLPGGTTGTAYSQTVNVTGGVSPYSWGATGLPSGLSIGASNGTISGTPSVSGTFTVALTVTESNGATATKSLSLVIAAPPLSVTTASLPNGTVGTAYSTTVAASGGVPGYTWSATGLPSGVTIAPSTGVIGGTPTTGGTLTVSVTVTDSASVSTTRSYSVTFTVPPLSITTRSLPGGTRGTAYNQTVAATGGQGARTWSVTSGSLPAGLSLNSSTGAITGIPTVRATYKFTITVRDSSSPQLSASKAFQMKVA